MNPELLLKHFDRISNAPEAIPCLRRLVFKLAVRGMLVEQNPGDQPVGELLKRLQFEKARLVKEGKVKRQDPLPAVDERSIPFPIPRHWGWFPLLGVGVLSGGMTPSKNRPDFWDGDINWFSPKDIKSDELAESELKITSAGVLETGLQTFPPGCLFMVARSGILKRTFPIAINRVEATANQDLKVLSPFIGGLQRYLQIMFRGMTDFILADLVKTGTTVQSLKYEEFELQPLPIPPLAEQQRIVAKVDQLMALCDRLEAAKTEREARRDRAASAFHHYLTNGATAEAFRGYANSYLSNLSRLTTRPDQINRFRRTILNLAVRGQLIPQNTNDEPASFLLVRLTEQIKKYVSEQGISPPRPAPIAEGDIPHPLPNGWIWTRLCSIFKVITDGDHQPPPKEPNGVAFLTIGNITTGSLDFSNCRFVSPSYLESVAEYRKPLYGDILYTVVGATYGRPVLVDTKRPFCVQRHIAILKPPRDIDIRFMRFLLASTLVYSQATKSATGAAQPTVALKPLRNFLVPLPPLAEQRRIVVKVDELMNLCDLLEAQLTTARTETGRLLESVLHRALNGSRSD
jgi:type I restriction enzyme, S subunit